MRNLFCIIISLFFSILTSFSGLLSFPLTSTTYRIDEDIISGTGTVEIQTGTVYTIAEDISAQPNIIGSSKNSTCLLFHGYLGSLLSGSLDSLFAKIFYPKNHSQVTEITGIKGSAHSEISINHVQLTIKRIEDSKFFNGISWQNNPVWLLCTGRESWHYPVKSSIFDYNKYYEISAKACDVALNEEQNPKYSTFEFIYKLTLESSLINYPNPFYPSSSEPGKNKTILEYYLENSEAATVVIYNINYERIREFKENIQGKGLHQITWDGKDDHGRVVPSGIYYLVVKSGPQKAVNQIGVIR